MLSNPEWGKSQLLDLNTPSLKALSYILRHKDLWPKGFRWYYGDCETCAMGMAHKIWSAIKSPTTYDVRMVLKINQSIAEHIFIGTYAADGYKTFYAITPEAVADRIDFYLNTSIIKDDIRTSHT